MAPSRPYSRWAAIRVLAIVSEDGYSTDQQLRAELGLDPVELRTLLGIMYRQRRIDRVCGYIVLPARPPLRAVA